MAHINNRLNRGDNVEKFPIFDIETTENKITIHGACGSIVFWDYTREEAVKQYKDHFNGIKTAEAFKETGEAFRKAADTIDAVLYALRNLERIYGI